MGKDHLTFRLGDDMLLRFPKAKKYAIQVDKEHKFLPLFDQSLSFKIPEILDRGKPELDYEWDWSIYRWIKGEILTNKPGTNKRHLVEQLARFFREMHQINTLIGLPPEKHNSYKGGKIKLFETKVIKSLELIEDRKKAILLKKIWDSDSETKWGHPSVWIHGDISPDNLIIDDGKLAGIIDFGLIATGDPACDYAIFWVFFDAESRKYFREQYAVDGNTWRRARAWALWKALIFSSGISNINCAENLLAQNTLTEIIQDYHMNG